ncbi:MAG: hypothetical protein IJK89_07025 [Clostridia bacterium]|nr:hypothetical protein [Clostridia bacterium]
MPRTRMIASYPRAELVSVTKRPEMDYDEWRWREDLVGQTGRVEVYEVPHKVFTEHCILFEPEGDIEYCLATGRGDLQLADNKMELVTKNTQYAFKLLDNPPTNDVSNKDRETVKEG